MVGFPGLPILVDYTDTRNTGNTGLYRTDVPGGSNKKPVEQTLHGYSMRLVNVVHGVIDVKFTRWGDKTFIFNHFFQLTGFVVHNHNG